MGQFKQSRSNISYDVKISKTSGTVDFGADPGGDCDSDTIACITQNGTRRGSIEVTLETAITASGAGSVPYIIVSADLVVSTDVIAIGVARPSTGNTQINPFVGNIVDGSFMITLANYTSGTIGADGTTIVVNWVAL